MPPAATNRPLITEVTRNDNPVAVPTSPLALSRRSSGMSRVTRVGIAIVRRLPVTTPSISSTTKTHSRRLPGSRNTTSGVVR
jgi:hypothetical protein